MQVNKTINFNLTFKDISIEKAKKVDTSGLYIFFNAENEVIYVGQSKNLGSRIYTHFSNKGSHTRKFIDEVSFIKICDEVPLEELDLNESFLIDHLKPKRNRHTYDKNKSMNHGRRVTSDEIRKMKNMYYLEGITMSGIAEEMGCTDKTVSKYVKPMLNRVKGNQKQKREYKETPEPVL